MVVYFLACIVSISIAWIGLHTREYKKGIICITILFSALPLFLIAALRYGVGTDYFNYIRVYEWIKEGVFYKEYLYNAINMLVIWLDWNVQWVFVICAFLFLGFSYSAIFRDSPYPLLSIFLLVAMTHYFAFLNIMRQMVGAAILLYGLQYIEQRNLKKYILCVALATGFHFTCILFIILYWSYNVKLTPKKAMILSVMLLLCGNYLKEIFYSIISKTTLSWYIGSKYDTGTVGYVYIMVQIAILGLVMWSYTSLPKYRIYFTIQTINLWLAFFSGRIVLVERFRYLFGFPAIILIPLAIGNIKQRDLRFLMVISIVVLFTVYGYHVTTSGNNGVLPYIFIFNK